MSVWAWLSILVPLALGLGAWFGWWLARDAASCGRCNRFDPLTVCRECCESRAGMASRAAFEAGRESGRMHALQAAGLVQVDGVLEACGLSLAERAALQARMRRDSAPRVAAPRWPGAMAEGSDDDRPGPGMPGDGGTW